MSETLKTTACIMVLLLTEGGLLLIVGYAFVHTHYYTSTGRLFRSNCRAIAGNRTPSIPFFQQGDSKNRFDTAKEVFMSTRKTMLYDRTQRNKTKASLMPVLITSLITIFGMITLALFGKRALKYGILRTLQ